MSSDLPGTLVAQVRHNVYDTATGRRLLIPQGARLVGRYDSRVTPGRERVEVAWTRLVFPDASTLELGGMPGADQGGYGGLSDRVNNHVGRVIGNVLLLSVFSAGGAAVPSADARRQHLRQPADRGGGARPAAGPARQRVRPPRPGVPASAR
ncbi:TrbI/VirB10 family protein [Azospirillum oleiclasticum]|uniref:TrbI/VirB10 family protein n=1 Tax=Azospirillum oleiclasticum TaxID=2735135 RepID=UPI001B3BD95E